jgi:hypothetical protein
MRIDRPTRPTPLTLGEDQAYELPPIEYLRGTTQVLQQAPANLPTLSHAVPTVSAPQTVGYISHYSIDQGGQATGVPAFLQPIRTMPVASPETTQQTYSTWDSRPRIVPGAASFQRNVYSSAAWHTTASLQEMRQTYSMAQPTSVRGVSLEAIPIDVSQFSAPAVLPRHSQSSSIGTVTASGRTMLVSAPLETYRSAVGVVAQASESPSPAARWIQPSVSAAASNATTTRTFTTGTRYANVVAKTRNVTITRAGHAVVTIDCWNLDAQPAAQPIVDVRLPDQVSYEAIPATMPVWVRPSGQENTRTLTLGGVIPSQGHVAVLLRMTAPAVSVAVPRFGNKAVPGRPAFSTSQAGRAGAADHTLAPAHAAPVLVRSLPVTSRNGESVTLRDPSGPTYRARTMRHNVITLPR